MYFQPIKNPGLATVSFKASSLRQLSGRLPTTINLSRTVAGLSLPVRCTIVQGIYFGSCSFNDLCKDILKDVMQDLVVDAFGFMFAHASDFNCPFDIQPQSIENSLEYEVPDFSTSIVSFLASGDFDLTVIINNTSNQHVACLRFKYTMQKPNVYWYPINDRFNFYFYINLIKTLTRIIDFWLLGSCKIHDSSIGYLDFAFEHKIDDVCQNLDLSRPTVIKFFRRLREIICLDASIDNIKLGGLGEVVEIDESKFAKVKHGVGKDLKRKLVIYKINFNIINYNDCYFSYGSSVWKKDSQEKSILK